MKGGVTPNFQPMRKQEKKTEKEVSTFFCEPCLDGISVAVHLTDALQPICRPGTVYKKKVETLHAEIDQREASIAKLTEDMAELTEDIVELTKAGSELNAAMSKAPKNRGDEKATNTDHRRLASCSEFMLRLTTQSSSAEKPAPAKRWRPVACIN